MSVIAKASNHDVTDEQDSIAKRKRRKIQSIESANQEIDDLKNEFNKL